METDESIMEGLECFECFSGIDESKGKLVCCFGCEKSYHQICHIPKIQNDELDEWYCINCLST